MIRVRKKNQSFSKIPILIGTLFLLMMLSFQPADALSESFDEDFTSTAYMDMSATNVTGWGTGEIRNPKMNPVIVGNFPSTGYAHSAYEVVVRDNIAFLADYEGSLKSIDISNKSNPVLTGEYPWGNQIVDIFVDGDYGYMIDTVGVGSYDWLRVVNLTDPAHPQTIASARYDHFSGMKGLCVSGNYIYLATGYYGLIILNTTEVTNLHEVDICDTPGYAREVEVVGDYAYVVDRDYGLQVINITNPNDATIVGSCDTPGTAVGLGISGNFAYVADLGSGVQVVNITDPTNPTLVSFIDTPNNSQDVEIVGDLAYIADSFSGLHVANISDPTNPEIVGACDTPGMALSVVVSGEYAYVADHDSGLQIIQIADIAPLSSMGDCATPGLSFSVSVDGNYAYVGGENLTVVDVSNPSYPATVGSYVASAEILDLSVEGDLVYLVDGYDEGLHVVNVSDPTNPTQEGYWAASDSVNGIEIEGDHAYLAAGANGLQVIDITDPSTPFFVSEYVIPSFYALGVSVDGNKAYMVGSDGYFHILDITNPHYPSLVGSYNYSMPIGSAAMSVWVLDDYAYITDFMLGLQIINIKDPTNMAIAGNYSFSSESYNLWIEGDYAFITTDSNGLNILDISNRTNPILVDSIPTLDTAVGVYVVGDHAFVASLTHFEVFEVMHSRVRQYESMTVATSLSVIDIPGDWSEVQATLTVADYVPAGTSITYYLSADNGTHWEPATPGIPHVFSYLGENIRWKAELVTTVPLETPIINELSISLTSVLDAPSLLSPGDSAFINDTTPTLEWLPISGATDYFLQIDTTSAFNSGDLANITVYGATTYTLPSPLTEETWYWRVFAIDSDDDLGIYSGTRSFTIDITPPGTTTLLTPANDTIQTNNTRPFYWTHVSGTHHYVIQFDTTPMFNSVNLLMEEVASSNYYPSTPIADGTWYWRVCAVDVAGNYGSYTPYWLVTFDTTAPVWNTPATDQIAEFAHSFRYDCSASDPSGIFAYNVNDTTRFGVFGNGTIYNNIFLNVGEYWLEVNAVDWVGHLIGTTFKITVTDTLGPTWEDHVNDLEFEFGHHIDFGWIVFDPSGVDHYAVSDTTHFSIDSIGQVYNITVLEPGTYELTIYAFDIYGNEGSTSITIIVLEAVTETTTTQPPPDYSLMMIALGGGAVVIVIMFLRRKS